MAAKTPEERRAARRARNRRYWQRHGREIAKNRLALRRLRRIGRPVDTHDALMAVLAKYRKERGFSGEALDDRAGFTTRYVSKLEIGAKRGGRNLGRWSLEILLKTLGVKLVVVKDEERP